MFICEDIFMQMCNDDALNFGAIPRKLDHPKIRAIVWIFTH